MDFPFSCTIEPASTENEYHNVSYGTPVTSECNYKDITELDPEKNIEVESSWFALPPETIIKPDSRVTLDNGKQYIASSFIRKVRRLSDNEIDYIRVILGFPLNGRNL
ncbi:MAG: hypothetical protein WCS17_03935 [Prevotella sp.]